MQGYYARLVCLRNEIGEVAVHLLQQIPEIKSVGRRAGRAERDDHVMPVSVNELDVEFHESERYRNAPEKLGDLLIETGSGQRLPLRLVADLREATGPNVINRENGGRRIVIGANATERDLQSAIFYHFGRGAAARALANDSPADQ